MIAYKNDGVTLAYTKPDGTEVSAGPMDTDRYVALLTTRAAQIDAGNTNVRTSSDYRTKLANAQISIDAGRAAGIVLPVKPLQVQVSNEGVESLVPFIPALPDAVYPIAAPYGSGSIKSAPAPDRIDVLMAVLMTVNAKLDKLLAVKAA